MAQLNKLTQKVLDTSKPTPKGFTLADGGGLILQITPSGGRRWRFRYRFHGREKMLSLGTYPDTSLALARKKRDEAKALLSEGLDPSGHRQAEKATHAITFKAVAEEWLKEEYAPSVVEQTYTETCRRFEVYVYPYVGNLPINEITVPDVRAILDRIHARGAAETVKKTRQGMSAVFRYAQMDGRAELDPAAVLSRAKKYSVKNIRRHRPSIVDREDGTQIIDLVKIGGLLRNVDAYHGDLFTKYGLQLLAYLFVRPGELQHARWQDIDFKNAYWVIPGYTKKERRDDLVVPLAPQAMRIFRELYKATGDKEYVFHSFKGKHGVISENTFNHALHKLGYKGTHSAHGYRALARTVLPEILGFDREWVRVQLAHKSTDPLGGAYDRITWIAERSHMMRVWADFLDAVQNSQPINPSVIASLKMKHGGNNNNVIQFAAYRNA